MAANAPVIDDQTFERRMTMNEEIMKLTRDVEQQSIRDVYKKEKSTAQLKTEWNSAGAYWPPDLPKPPSMKYLFDDADYDPNAPTIIVFNANTAEGSSMVRVLAEKKLQVIAVVRVFTSRNAKMLHKLKGVTVKVADLNNLDAVIEAAQGCDQAFLVTKYWERFESMIEENMAKVVLEASHVVGVKRLVLTTFEDTTDLRVRNRKSQLVPTDEGFIYPHFEGMESIDLMARNLGIRMTHMMTSYLEENNEKRSITLIRGENGRIIIQPHIQGQKSN
jgi:hypothetical protein